MNGGSVEQFDLTMKLFNIGAVMTPQRLREDLQAFR